MHDGCKTRGVTATERWGEGMGGQNPGGPRRNKERRYERCRAASTSHPGVGLGERSEGPRILRPHSFRRQERSFATLLLLGRGVGPAPAGAEQVRGSRSPRGPQGGGRGTTAGGLGFADGPGG